jgi:hypothetical protein
MSEDAAAAERKAAKKLKKETKKRKLAEDAATAAAEAKRERKRQKKEKKAKKKAKEQGEAAGGEGTTEAAPEVAAPAAEAQTKQPGEEGYDPQQDPSLSTKEKKRLRRAAKKAAAATTEGGAAAAPVEQQSLHVEPTVDAEGAIQLFCKGDKRQPHDEHSTQMPSFLQNVTRSFCLRRTSRTFTRKRGPALSSSLVADNTRRFDTQPTRCSTCRAAKKKEEGGSVLHAARACFECGETGHLSYNCPRKGGKGGKKGALHCYNCGETSHTSKQCPHR